MPQSVDLDNRAWMSLVEQHQTGRIEGAAYFERVSNLLDGVYTPAEVEQIHLAWTMQPYPGVRTLIEDIAAHKVQTCALSNTNHEHWEIITQHPELRAMDQLIASHIIGLHKPDPCAYAHVESVTGCAGDEVIFFDDSQENIDAAEVHGWRTVHIDHSGHTAQQMRDALDAHGTLHFIRDS